MRYQIVIAQTQQVLVETQSVAVLRHILSHLAAGGQIGELVSDAPAHLWDIRVDTHSQTRLASQKLQVRIPASEHPNHKETFLWLGAAYRVFVVLLNAQIDQSEIYSEDGKRLRRWITGLSRGYVWMRTHRIPHQADLRLGPDGSNPLGSLGTLYILGTLEWMLPLWFLAASLLLFKHARVAIHLLLRSPQRDPRWLSDTLNVQAEKVLTEVWESRHYLVENPLASQMQALVLKSTPQPNRIELQVDPLLRMQHLCAAPIDPVWDASGGLGIPPDIDPAPLSAIYSVRPDSFWWFAQDSLLRDLPILWAVCLLGVMFGATHGLLVVVLALPTMVLWARSLKVRSWINREARLDRRLLSHKEIHNYLVSTQRVVPSRGMVVPPSLYPEYGMQNSPYTKDSILLFQRYMGELAHPPAAAKMTVPGTYVAYLNQYGCLDREDGPALILPDMIEFHKDGGLHREDGPARISRDGRHLFALHGLTLTYEEFLAKRGLSLYSTLNAPQGALDDILRTV